MYKLHYIVLGHDPHRIFAVDIAQTQTRTVGDLGNVTEDEKPEFEHIAADDLKLWQVDLTVNETIEHHLNNLTLDTKKLLSPGAKMLQIFDNAPQHNHLHIVIQCPDAVSSRPLHLKLNSKP
ncbi:uncharacterized protein EDB93DRAFT_1253496 [Suillus bovinus]|uniref:uncharacterized protein n=1 Tax=Suillus bovinus TaxID=48563 RepID=UPI001B872C59|nr:uncharacterized protein EDB93DRAFT_1253496 [Suillus bovinus]KAG2137839.1 hypothetical protein EDB93DRAFT_1253496 [Suillus bovinus]